MPFTGGAEPSVRLPISSIDSPTAISEGIESVAHINVEIIATSGYFSFVAAPSMMTLAVWFASCPVTTRRMRG